MGLAGVDDIHLDMGQRRREFGPGYDAFFDAWSNGNRVYWVLCKYTAPEEAVIMSISMTKQICASNDFQIRISAIRA